jgi:hypothetical protein
LSKIAKALREALALMNDSGAHWTQGEYMSKSMNIECAYCSVGAVRAVTAGHPHFTNEDTDAVLRVLSRELPSANSDGWENQVIDWNDAADRTWEDIVDAFTKAADREEKRALNDLR